MVKITTKVIVTGIDFVIRVVNNLLDNVVFKDNVSEEYKAGFYNFGSALLEALEEMQEDSNG